MHPLLFALLACKGADRTPSDDSGGGDGSGGDQPADFTGRGYRIGSLAILGEGEGKDWDGDGEIDNALPTMLSTFETILGFKISKDGLNLMLAQGIESDTLTLLVEASSANGILTLDLLRGIVGTNGDLSVDEEHSYQDGEPISRLVGALENGGHYAVGPDSIVVPIPFDVKSLPAPFPVEEAAMEGTLDAGSLIGTAVGIVPIDGFVSDVLPIFIPAEGYDLDGNGTIDPDSESQKVLLGLVAPLFELSADVETSDGRPGLSAAFRFAASAATFE